MNFDDNPYLFPIFFVGMWLFISALFSMISGWWSLAEVFRATARPEGGERIRSQVKQVGWVPENRVTHMVAAPAGLYLYASLLFRFLHPALLIPWSSVGKAQRISIFWWPTYDYDLGSITTIRVTKRAHEAIEAYRR